MENLILDVPVERVDKELVGIEVGLINLINEYMIAKKISYRKLEEITGISSGSIRYHLTGEGNDSLGKLLLIIQKLDFKGNISVNISPPENNITEEIV